VRLMFYYHLRPSITWLHMIVDLYNVLYHVVKYYLPPRDSCLFIWLISFCAYEGHGEVDRPLCNLLRSN